LVWADAAIACACAELEEVMDKKLVGLIGAVAGLATAGGAQAAIDPPALSEALHASSYADLLAPIANPVELLKADNAVREQQAADFQVAQGYYPYYGNYPYSGYYNYPYYHHHHHHNNYYRPYSYQHHHHHHHHHNSAFIGIPGVGGIVVPR
jgi:hypothetical protein